MKIKNSNERLKLSTLVPFAYGSILLFSVLRCFQVVKYIDSETGFFIGGSWLKYLLYGAIAVVCLGFLVVSYLSSDGENVELVGLNDRTAGVSAVIFALSLFYDAFDSMSQSIVTLNDVSVGYFERSTDIFKKLMASGTLPYALQSLFAIFSAVYIIILAKSFLKGTKNAHTHRLLALTPIAWAAFKMVTRFVKQISYIKVSDLFLELIMLAFMITFFVTLSQVVSGVYSDDTRWRITALGFSGAVLALSVNIPRLVLTLVANEFVNVEYPFSPDDAMFGLFAFSVAVAAIKSACAEKSKA